jgi:5,5'-dehydrodivanillate O-demethylase oxygenase subunit
MLTTEENDLLCRVGPGTPMGELMRRYWQPIAATSELTDERPVKPVRILGEDLALFRDLSDRLGLISLYCPHRLRPLTYGIPEEEGLRCPYTGWLFDVDGRCLDIPFEPEDSVLKYEVRTPAYPAQELGGLIWAYLGPQPAPLLPPWDLLVADNVFRQIGHALLPCNWLQCMESTVDPIDNPYLYSTRTRGSPRLRMPRVAADRPRILSEFDRNQHGVVQRCRLLGPDAGGGTQTREWTEAHPLIFPVMVRSGNGFRQALEFRVPVDDTHTWNICYQAFVPGNRVKAPKQHEIPFFEIPIRNESGDFIFDVPGARDMVLWVSQGDMLDRTREHLSEGDRGVELYRRMLQHQVAIVEDGGDPINTFRAGSQMKPSIDLKPNGNEATLPLPSFDPSTKRAGVERYSPEFRKIQRLYRRIQKAEGQSGEPDAVNRRAKAVPARGG